MVGNLFYGELYFTAYQIKIQIKKNLTNLKINLQSYYTLFEEVER